MCTRDVHFFPRNQVSVWGEEGRRGMPHLLSSRLAGRGSHVACGFMGMTARRSNAPGRPGWASSGTSACHIDRAAVTLAAPASRCGSSARLWRQCSTTVRAHGINWMPLLWPWVMCCMGRWSRTAVSSVITFDGRGAVSTFLALCSLSKRRYGFKLWAGCHLIGVAHAQIGTVTADIVPIDRCLFSSDPGPVSCPWRRPGAAGGQHPVGSQVSCVAGAHTRSRCAR